MAISKEEAEALEYADNILPGKFPKILAKGLRERESELESLKMAHNDLMEEAKNNAVSLGEHKAVVTELRRKLAAFQKVVEEARDANRWFGGFMDSKEVDEAIASLDAGGEGER